MRYIALFRGLNVGGKNRVEMALLRGMLSGLGLERVSTYIQSGNALFESPGEEAILREEIQKAFLETFGFESPVILRTAEELAAIVQGVPFAPEELAQAREASPETESLYCYLLEAALPQAQAEALQAAAQGWGKDQAVIRGREIYLLCYQSIRSSKAAAALERLKVPMTCRNLKTLARLLELAE